jgi:hypothetical protein
LRSPDRSRTSVGGDPTKPGAGFLGGD